MIYIGIIVIFLAHILPILAIEWKLSEGSGIYITANHVFTWFGNNGNLSGFTLIITAILFITIRITFDKLWHEYVKPSIIQSTDKINFEIKTASNDMKALLQSHKLDSAILTSNPDEIRKKLKDIHTAAYGSHCDSERGLYTALAETAGIYLDPNKPHRSNHNQEITIEEQGDLVKWTEHTTYELHTISLDGEYKTPQDDTKKIEYSLEYETTAIYSNIEDIDFQMKVDDEEIVSLKDVIKIEKNDDGSIKNISSTDDCVSIEYEDSGLCTFRVVKPITITKGKTKIWMKEESLVTDSCFVSRRDTPICNCSITITIPSTWEFEHFSIPSGNRWTVIDNAPAYKRKAYTSDWVLPGILASCSWKQS